MVARVCHVYGYLPKDVLGMAYRHFIVLYRYTEQNERKRAQYMAVAFGNPKSLFEDGSQAKKVTQTNMTELLRACNG